MENKKLTIDEKMEYIRKALEMGAHVNLGFHGHREKEEAQKAADELSLFTGLSYQEFSHKGTNWFKFNRLDGEFEATIFFDDKETKADIFDDEEEEIA